jgi:hypothetical protein
MDVIPLTLALSLFLSLTFIALFVREFSRPRRAGADRDSLLPFEPDHVTPALAATDTAGVSPATASRVQVDDDTCASQRTDGKCCASCQRRKDRAAARAAARAAGTSA